MRQVSHSKAWNYKNRPREVRGRHFNLTDCVVWMTVMFMAGREVGLDQHEVFWDWFIGFISHFIAVYYTEGAAEWSEREANVIEYKKWGRMADLSRGGGT